MEKKPRRKAITPDPGEQSDWGSHAQTNEPWKGNPEKDQRPNRDEVDLEKWQESGTH